MAKTYAGTYLYSKYSVYEQKIFTFLMEGTEIDKNTSDFEDIKYDVKRRQVSNALIRVLESKNVILMIGKTAPMDKAFKVFCAKDIKHKDSNKMKVFIDCSNIITRDPVSGKYVCRSNNIDIFISYLVSAMHTYIYYVDENRLVNNAKVMQVGAKAFSLLFTHVIDYACKISSMPSYRNKCMYLAALYYLSNLLGKDYKADGPRKIARDIAGMSERDAGIIDMQIKPESMQDIKFFVETVADILKLNKLTLDVVVERWMTIYGTGTIFSTELFPAFASMVTDAYVGAYLNNQKTIEKVAGNCMTEFTKQLLTIGAESV